MLAVFTVVVMFVVTYAFWWRDFMTVCTMFVNVLVAGRTDVQFLGAAGELLEPMFFGSFLQGYEDALCLTGIFWLTLVLLRMATNQFAPGKSSPSGRLQRGGGACSAPLTGYMVSGFLLCVFQTLPWQVHFLGFDPDYKAEEVTRSYICRRTASGWR